MCVTLMLSVGIFKHSGATLDARRRQFADRDRKKIERDRIHVKARLLRTQPPAGSNSGPGKSWTEMALLRNEFSKQKRFTPVRSLLTRAGRSIQELKPCFMMSPLSSGKVCRCANALEFDLLVRRSVPDEARGCARWLIRVKQSGRWGREAAPAN